MDKNVHMLQYDDLTSLPVDKKQRLRNIIYGNFEYLGDWRRLNHSTNEIDRLLSSPNSTIFLYMQNKSIAGYLVSETIPINDKNVLFINYIYVVSKYRGHNIGKTLMKSAIDHALYKKLKRVTLITDTHSDAYKWYKKIGFKEDTDMDRPTDQHIVMYLNLDR